MACHALLALVGFFFSTGPALAMEELRDDSADGDTEAQGDMPEYKVLCAALTLSWWALACAATLERKDGIVDEVGGFDCCW
jgi:hypothetical protein